MHHRPLPDDCILQSPRDEEAESRSRIHRVVSLARRGKIRRAIQALEQPRLPPLTHDRIAYLLSLHPPRTREVNPPGSIARSCPPVLDEAVLLKLIRQCDDGTAAGPSNLTAAHLAGLATDPDCLAGLIAIVQDIINGELSDAAADVITAAISVATDKGGDRVRPLAVPEILYKLAGLVVLESIEQHIPALFKSIQLGCGVKNGVEIAIHRTQLALELGRAGSDTVVLSLDFRNAFNERSRHIIAEALFAADPTSPLWKFFMMAYGRRPAFMGIYQRGELIHHFLNSNGVKQGCPIAAFLYALSVQSIYTNSIAGDKTLEAVAIADDFTITGPSSAVLAALRPLIEICAADGPTLNFTKCVALWAYSTNHVNYQPFRTAMAELNIPIQYHSIPLLGSSIGLGMNRAPHVLAAADDHQRFFSLLSHKDMPMQIALLLLRLSGVPRFSYLIRVTPPVIIRAAAERFDQLVVTTAATVCKLPDPGKNVDILQAITLPLRLDGMGLTPHTRTSPAAYFSSLAASAFDTANDRTPATMQLLLTGTDTAFHLNDTYDVLVKNGVDPQDKKNKQRIPLSITDFWSFYATSKGSTPPRGLQRHFSTIITDHFYLKSLSLLKLTELTPPPDPSQPSPPPTSSYLYTTSPTSHDTNINNHHFRLALRHRLYLPPVDGLPATCDCGAPLRADPAHFHSCRKNKKVGVYHRHELIVTCLIILLRRAGFIVSREPPMRDDKGNRTVPDIKIIAHNGIVLIDVSVCCIYSKTNVALVKRNADPIQQRETQKTKKYAAATEANDADFIAFVVNSAGQFGDGALRLFDLLVARYAETNPQLQQQRSLSNMRESFMRAVAVQLHVGNALVMSLRCLTILVDVNCNHSILLPLNRHLCPPSPMRLSKPHLRHRI
jgi:hypothetical protein